MRCDSSRPSRRTSRTAFSDLPPEPDDPLLGFAPYLHAMPRRNSITPERQRAFIAALAASGIVTQAARSIGASLEALYRLRNQPGAEEFAAAWEAAIDRGIARLEDCALELALRGEELPIVSAGHMLGTYRKHNFAHIRFVLSQRWAERYGRSEGGRGTVALDPASPAYAKLREQWREEYEAEKRAAAEKNRMADEKFLEKLNRRIEYFRQEAISASVMKLLPGGRSEWVDPELRRHYQGEDDALE